MCVWDSSGWQLNERLQETSRGTGGSGSKAGCKLQYCYDLKSSSIIHCELTDGVTPDQRYGQEHISARVKKGDLFLFDLGYFSHKTLAAVSEKGGFFISRIDLQTTIFFNKKRTDLHSWLKRHKNKSSVEINALVGKKDMPCRVIAIKLPEKERNERIRKLKKQAKKKGRRLSKQRIFFASWNILITNAPKEKLKAKQIYPFYRLRWSVELVFKQFKSSLNIHSWNHANINRLRCEVFATLIIAAILSFAHNLLQQALWKKHQSECSFEKTCKFFVNNAHMLFLLAEKNSKLHRKQITELLGKAKRFCVRSLQLSRTSSLQNIQILA